MKIHVSKKIEVYNENADKISKSRVLNMLSFSKVVFLCVCAVKYQQSAYSENI